MFLKNRIAPEDQRKEKVYYCFKRNLEDILRVGRAAHVPMILSTVAVNLKDCAPFGSLTNTIAGASGPQFEQLYAEAVEEQGRGDFAVAARGFENAAALEPHHAELHFHWVSVPAGTDQCRRGESSLHAGARRRRFAVPG
jgi:hypothetical protein